MMTPSTKLKVVGIDPSLRNWGIAVAELDLNTMELNIDYLHLIQPIITTGKQVRQNSKDLEAATQLYMGNITPIENANAIFIEVPVGSQSARAMASYGICIGILGALRGIDVPFFEVTPTEVKMAGPGIRTASKIQMINWATQKHPEANWPTHIKYGVKAVSEAKAEHLADAIGAIYAGIGSNTFKQLLSMMTVKH